MNYKIEALIERILDETSKKEKVYSLIEEIIELVKEEYENDEESSYNDYIDEDYE